jgi:hypothetical protein
MQADTLQAGCKLIDENDPGLAATLNEDIRLDHAYVGELRKCEAAAAQAGKEQRRTLGVQPSAKQVNGQPVGRNNLPHVLSQSVDRRFNLKAVHT